MLLINRGPRSRVATFGSLSVMLLPLLVYGNGEEKNKTRHQRLLEIVFSARQQCFHVTGSTIISRCGHAVNSTRKEAGKVYRLKGRPNGSPLLRLLLSQICISHTWFSSIGQNDALSVCNPPPSPQARGPDRLQVPVHFCATFSR